MKSNQLTNIVVMVSPNHFGFNSETAKSNVFAHLVKESEKEVQEKALAEFNNAVEILRKNEISVLILESREDVITPDSIFPNNWFSHHTDGKLVIYPMLASNRIAERQPEALENLLKSSGVPVSEIIDLTQDENSGKVLEGTGSLVLDRENKTVFAMESVRTTKIEFDKWSKIMGYEGILFHGYDSKDFPIYHTNMAMSIGNEYAVVCLDSIIDGSERRSVEERLKRLGKEIIEITIEQIFLYCGNTLQIVDKEGNKKIVMSKTAFEGFNKEQLEKLKKYGQAIILDLPAIENVGGGSARCILAEVFR